MSVSNLQDNILSTRIKNIVFQEYKNNTLEDFMDIVRKAKAKECRRKSNAEKQIKKYVKIARERDLLVEEYNRVISEKKDEYYLNCMAVNPSF